MYAYEWDVATDAVRAIRGIREYPRFERRRREQLIRQHSYPESTLTIALTVHRSVDRPYSREPDYSNQLPRVSPGWCAGLVGEERRAHS